MQRTLTTAAQALWDAYLREAESRLAARTDVDVDEVRENLEQHLDGLLADQADPVGPDALRRAIRLLGPIEGEPGDAAAAPGAGTPWVALGVAAAFILGLAAFPWTGPLSLLPAYLASRYVGPAAGGRERWLVWPPALLGASFVAAGLPVAAGLLAGTLLAEQGYAGPERALLTSLAVGAWTLALAGLALAAWPRLGRAVLWPLDAWIQPRVARRVALVAGIAGVSAALAALWIR